MITRYFRTLKDSELKEVLETRSGVWIHAVSPSEAELQELFAELALDEALIEDALDFYEVPRFERSSGATFFFTRYPFAENQEDTDTAPLLVVLGESFVLTVVQREIPQLKPLIDGTTIVHTTQKTKLFIQIMQEIVDAFERDLVRLRRSVHKDRAKLRRIGNREIERFVTVEHKLSDMIAAVLPTNTALQQITKARVISLHPNDVDLMEDLVIDNTQLVDSARSVLNTIQNVRSAAEAILTNTLNNRIKTLTVLTILLTIPTIISSLYGMNVQLPGMDQPWAFAAVLGSIVVLVALALAIFKKNEWL
jgi:magnesium transporter